MRRGSLIHSTPLCASLPVAVSAVWDGLGKTDIHLTSERRWLHDRQSHSTTLSQPTPISTCASYCWPLWQAAQQAHLKMNDVWRLRRRASNAWSDRTYLSCGQHASNHTKLAMYDVSQLIKISRSRLHDYLTFQHYALAFRSIRSLNPHQFKPPHTCASSHLWRLSPSSRRALLRTVRGATRRRRRMPCSP